MTNRGNANESGKSTIQGAGLFKVTLGTPWDTFSRSLDKNLLFSVAGDTFSLKNKLINVNCPT